MAKLELYFKTTCPYCQKVLSFMQQNNMTIALMHNVQEEQNRNQLIKVGGKPQVPCLIIDGKAMYESDDIIAWLKKNYKN